MMVCVRVPLCAEKCLVRRSADVERILGSVALTATT